MVVVIMVIVATVFRDGFFRGRIKQVKVRPVPLPCSTFILKIAISLFSWGEAGQRLDSGRSLVEWGDFLSVFHLVCLSFSLSVSFHSCLASPQTWLVGPQVWLALAPGWLGLGPVWLSLKPG